MGPSWGSHFLIRLIYGKHEKIFLSETTRPRALIICWISAKFVPIKPLLEADFLISVCHLTQKLLETAFSVPICR